MSKQNRIRSKQCQKVSKSMTGRSIRIFTCVSSLVRLAEDILTLQKSLFRNSVSLIVSTVILLKDRKSFRPFSARSWPLLPVRSFCGTVGILANFYAVDHLFPADATMLNKLSPFLRSSHPTFCYGSDGPCTGPPLAGAFVGAMFIIKPSFGNMDLLPPLIGLLGGITAGMAFTFVRLPGKRGECKSYIVFLDPQLFPVR